MPSASTSAPESAAKLPAWALIVSVASALVFLLLLFVTAIFISDPKPFQIFIFRVLLGLAAAAFGATIPGFLRLDLPLLGRGMISVTGALALFVLVYRVNPPALVTSDRPATPEIVMQSLAGAILDGQGEPLPGVTVTLPHFSRSATTDAQGAFFFEVKAERDASVRLMAQKTGCPTHRQDVTLGNTRLSFKMACQP